MQERKMGRGIQKWTEAVIGRFEKEGRGKGEGASYKPWLNIGDFASTGRTHDPLGIKTSRPHQLFSDNEYDFFLMLEWAADVVDIREQFPLPRDKTMEVAMQLGERHPYYPGTHVPTVMTVDFMVTRSRNGTNVMEAYNVKPTDEAEDEGSLVKLEIQRETLARMDIAHHLVFDTMIPEQQVKNLAWVRGGQLRAGERQPYEGFFEEQMAAMTADLASTEFAGSLVKYCQQYDSRAGIASGTAMRVARMLMARRVVRFDLATPSPELAPISDFAVHAMSERFMADQGELA
jgi:hypothetical protein